MLSSRGSSRPGTDPLRTVHFVNSKTLLFSYIISEVGMHLIFSICVYVLSHVQLFATPCTVACQAPHVISQARILEWVAIPFSRGSSQCRDRTGSPALQADSLPSEPPGKQALFTNRKDSKRCADETKEVFEMSSRRVGKTQSRPMVNGLS